MTPPAYARHLLESILGAEAAGAVSSEGFFAALATSVAVVVGVAFLLWRRLASGEGSGGKPVVVQPKPLLVKEDSEIDADPGKRKVTVFFGTQTGTAEGFAKEFEHVVPASKF